jgi:putative flippase GtrA
MTRWWKFNLVGAGGIAVQTVVLGLLVRLGVHYLIATIIAVEAAILHNFVWHTRWTWADRRGVSIGKPLARFHLLNGCVSLAGNFFIMRWLVGEIELPPFFANLVSIATCSLVNFVLADRAVYTTESGLGDHSL